MSKNQAADEKQSRVNDVAHSPGNRVPRFRSKWNFKKTKGNIETNNQEDLAGHEENWFSLAFILRTTYQPRIDFASANFSFAPWGRVHIEEPNKISDVPPGLPESDGVTLVAAGWGRAS